MKQQSVPVHQPNILAYVTLAGFLAIPGGLYLYLVHQCGATMVHGALVNIGIELLVMFGLAGVLFWLMTAERLLRFYHYDPQGLTVQRAFLPPLRFLWRDVQAVRRKSNAVIVEAAGGTRLKILLDYVTDADRLAHSLMAHAPGK
ncbi:MAG: hypothetical protein ACLFWB_01295 [Armatimonadota bacterium]